MKKHIVVSVSNDLVTDQRVARICSTLHQMGFQITLLGRVLPSTLSLNGRPYSCKRFRLWFNKGALFYANLNIRLFVYLLFRKHDILLANDLDTLPANWLISKIRRKELVYDSHEYFTGVPELEGRYAKKVWEAFERMIFPTLKNVYTVNPSIADLYQKQYGILPRVVRNVPWYFQAQPELSKKDLGIPENTPLIILQGAGINMHRGAEEAVEAMQWVKQGVLLIVGGGDVIDQLKQRVHELQLQQKVMFYDKQPLEKLRQYTAYADIGLSFDRDTNINYRYSLPNKLFDYIQGGCAVLCSDLVEVKRIVKQYQVGETIARHQPEIIAEQLNKLLNNQSLLQQYKANAKLAARELNWENEKDQIHKIYSKLV